MGLLSLLGQVPFLADRSPLVQLLLAAVTIALTYLIATTFYNIFLNPLRHLPGPFWAGASTLPNVYANAIGLQPHWVRALHARYGPVVRIAPDEVSFSDHQAWKDIHSATGPLLGPAGGRAGRADRVAEVFGAGLLPSDLIGTSIATEVDDAEHARIRKVFAPGFTDAALRRQEGIFEDREEALLKEWKKRAAVGEAVDVSMWMRMFTFDMMSMLMFGDCLRTVESGQENIWMAADVKSAPTRTRLFLLRYFPLVQPIVAALLWATPRKWLVGPQGHALTWGEIAIKRRMALFKREPDETKKGNEGGNRADIWSFVIESGQRDYLTDHEKHLNASVFMFAGSDTTASALTGAIYVLLRNPSKMAALQSELRGTFQSIDDMTSPAVGKLQYLNAVIEETLRIFPPPAQMSGRKIRKGGLDICGHRIPAKTVVYSQMYTMQLDEANFRHATDFIPERWFDPEFASDNLAAAQTFSVGPRKCIGQSLAYLEMRRLLARLIWTFDFELVDKDEDWIAKQRIWLVWTHGPMMVRIKERHS